MGPTRASPRSLLYAGRAVPLGRRLIARDSTRFAITSVGVGMTVVLMLFLLALYEGVRTEANGWVGSREVDAWVVQRSTTNFIKASSILAASTVEALQGPGVEEATPILRLISRVQAPGDTVTAIVIGLEEGSDAGRPRVVVGSPAPGSGEIVLDRALARTLGLSVEDSLTIEERPFRVIGLSRGTNSILTQFAFISLADAHALLGVDWVVSFVLVRGSDGIAQGPLIERLRERAPDADVLSQAAFSENNMGETREGLIPLLLTVAILGGLVAVVVLTLLLYGSVLERREDYALLKAMGASPGTLLRVVLGQAGAVVLGGLIVGPVAYLAAVPVVGALAPAVPVALTPLPVAAVVVGAFVIGGGASLLPLGRIQRIDPGEVFRA
jgi:putative ABC transport system permease protein